MKKFVKKFLCSVILSALVITMVQPVFSYAQDTEEEIGEAQQPEDENARKPLESSGKSIEKEGQQYDTVKPVIERIEFPQQGQTLKEGDTIYLYIYAYDSDSGIQDVAVYASYERGYSISGDVSYDEEKRCYVWKHVLENISGNRLTVNNIIVTDKMGHSTTMFDNGEYDIWADVEWQKPETTDVQIKNITFQQNGKTVNETEPLEISVETDKEFGIESMFLTFSHMSSDQRTISIWLRADETGKRFRNKEYCMDTCAENGKWTLCDISVMNFPDRPVNLHLDRIALEDYSFSFKQTSEVEKPAVPEIHESPVITRIELDRNGSVVSAGDRVSITVYTDADQELKETGMATFRAVSNISDFQKHVNLTYSKDKNAYEGTLEITDGMYPCEWYIESIEIRNTSGNLADDSSYTADANYPYYVLVKNGSTHVSPTYNLYVEFYTLDTNGEWKIAETAHQEKAERRQTLKEAGITFPERSTEYPGFNQIGWVDSNGNEVTESSECISSSGIMTVYAKYDKRIINVSYQSVSPDGVTILDSDKIIIPQDQTFGELKKAIENAVAPQGDYQGITFQGWKLDSADKYREDAPLPDKADISFMARAIYDKNVLVAFYKHPISNEEWRSESKAIVYEKGESYGEIIERAIGNAPEISLDGYELKKWQYKINGPKYEWLEDTPTDDSDNYMQIQCVPKFSGYTMILIRQSYITKEGNRDFYYPFYMAVDGTKWEDISKCLSALKVPEICENYTFGHWIFQGPAWPEIGSYGTIKNGFEFAMSARYMIPPETDVPGDKPTGGDHVIDKPSTDIPAIQPPEETQPDDQQSIGLPEEKISQVVELISNAEPGEPIHIDMADATVIPKEILEAAKGRNINIELDMGGYCWEVNGTEIVAADLKSIDLKVILDTDNIPSKTIQALAGDNLVQQLSLVHHGDFGFKAILTVNVGNEHAGQYGNLYYHDSTGKLVFIDAGEVAPSGNVSLTFSHASDYMIVMSAQKMSQANVPNEFAPTEQPGGNQTGGNQNQPGGGQTGSGDKDQAGNGSQGKPGDDTENPEQNASDTVRPQTETSSRNQAVPNSQNEAKTTSVQTGDEAEWISRILTSVLSLVAIIYIVKKKKAY